MADLDRLTWAPCPGRQAPPLRSSISDMIWYPLSGPSRSNARIAARTSPRPAFLPRGGPGGPGGPGPQPPHGPPTPPPQCPGPRRPPQAPGHSQEILLCRVAYPR